MELCCQNMKDLSTLKMNTILTIKDLNLYSNNLKSYFTLNFDLLKNYNLFFLGLWYLNLFYTITRFLDEILTFVHGFENYGCDRNAENALQFYNY